MAEYWVSPMAKALAGRSASVLTIQAKAETTAGRKDRSPSQDEIIRQVVQGESRMGWASDNEESDLKQTAKSLGLDWLTLWNATQIPQPESKEAVAQVLLDELKHNRTSVKRIRIAEIAAKMLETELASTPDLRKLIVALMGADKVKPKKGFTKQSAMAAAIEGIFKSRGLSNRN
jgi:hypothetical protein